MNKKHGPTYFMDGKTFFFSIDILDEAQNPKNRMMYGYFPSS